VSSILFFILREVQKGTFPYFTVNLPLDFGRQIQSSSRQVFLFGFQQLFEWPFSTPHIFLVVSQWPALGPLRMCFPIPLFSALWRVGKPLHLQIPHGVKHVTTLLPICCMICLFNQGDLVHHVLSFTSCTYQAVKVVDEVPGTPISIQALHIE
jgi:hypothetical protein